MGTFYQHTCQKLNLFKSAKFISTFIFIALISVLNAQSVTVTTTVDVVDGNTGSIALLNGTPGGAGISLRETIIAANNEPNGSTVTITLPAGNFAITIVGSDNTCAAGDLDVLVSASAGMKTVTINGAGSASTTITGLSGERIFDVHAASNPGSITFNLNAVRCTGGSPSSSSGAAILTGRAGDVTNITNSLFNNNVSLNNGGAISQSSGSVSHNLTITNCTFDNNTAGLNGAAISYSGSGGTVLIDQNVFTNNTASSSGGAIYITGTSPGPNLVNITKNTFTGNTANSATDGGAVVSFFNVVTINTNYNRIVGNTAPNVATGKMISFNVGGANTANNNDNNWWGINTGPVAANISGTATTRWLQLKNTASPSPICIAGTSTISAGFLSNNLNDVISSSNLSALVGLPITFNTAVNGTLSSAQTTIQAAGTATVTFTASTSGNGSANAVFVPLVENVTATTSPVITINLNNTIGLSSAAGTDNQTKCINTAITNITYATTGATGATFGGLPSGVTGGWASNVATISGTPTASGTFNYTVTLTGGCGAVSATGTRTITVTPNNTVSLTSAGGTNAQAVCNSSTITNITYATTGATGATFSGLPAGVTGNWAANVATISGSPTASGPFTYTVTLTGGCGTITATGSITVTALTTTLAGTAGGAQVCTNMNIGAVATYSDGSCNIISKLVPRVGAPLNGLVNTCVKIDATVQLTNSQPYLQRHYDIEPVINAANATATITLYYTQAEFNAYNIARGAYPALPTAAGDAPGKANLRITQYHGTGTAPGNYTGAGLLIDPVDANIVFVGSRWEVTFDVTGFSGFYLHTILINAPLPLNLLSFSGINSGSSNLLEWTTSSEQNGSYFELQRSINGINFDNVATVATAGNSAVNKVYQYNDNISSITTTLFYYRLKMVDISGRFKYSSVIKLVLNNKGVFSVTVSPNPVVDQLNVQVEATTKGKAIITLNSMDGKKILRQNAYLNKGSNIVPIDKMDNLPGGIYLLKVVTDTEEKIVKVIKQH